MRFLYKHHSYGELKAMQGEMESIMNNVDSREVVVDAESADDEVYALIHRAKHFGASRILAPFRFKTH